MHRLPLWLSTSLRRHGGVSTAERPFRSRTKHPCCDLIGDRVEEDGRFEMLLDGRWVLLNVTDVVVVWHVFALRLQRSRVLNHLVVQAVEMIMRDYIRHDDETVLVQTSHGLFKISFAQESGG